MVALSLCIEQTLLNVFQLPIQADAGRPSSKCFGFGVLAEFRTFSDRVEPWECERRSSIFNVPLPKK